MKNGKSNSKLMKFLSLWLSLALLTVGMPMGAYAADTTASQDGIEEGAVVEEALLAEGEEGEEEPSTPSENKPSTPPGNESVQEIEVNQGMGRHTGLNGGNETAIKDFVAKKQTAVTMLIPGSEASGYTEQQATEAVKGYKLEARAVNNGQEADSA